MGKGKMKKAIKEDKSLMMVKLSSYTKPQFAHNAGAAGKAPIWTYGFWRTNDKSNVGSFDLEMALGSVEIRLELITAEHRKIMAAKLRSVLSARMAMRLNYLILQKKFSIRWRHL